MNVLSLFDGVSCGQVALNRLGISPTHYFASEIDNHAIEVCKSNHPTTIHLGDVRSIKASQLPKIDLLIGGSPCQGFSFAGKQLNFDDERSKLFFEFVRILKEVREINPDVKFLLENVKMKKEYEAVITEYLGVTPIVINSALVSAQSRNRLYWTNIEGVTQPEDRNIELKDITEDGLNQIGASRGRFLIDGKRQDGKQKTAGLTTQRVEMRTDHKSNTLTTVGKDNLIITGVGEDGKPTYRNLTPLECERLQTLPDNYTSSAPKTQRIKMLGNAWTVEVIVHIFKNLLK